MTISQFKLEATAANKSNATWLKMLSLLLITLCISATSFADTAFQHTAKTSNISSHITTIDNPATNGKPNVIVTVTAIYGSPGVYVPEPIGVWYSAGKWKIFHQTFKPMKPNMKFNVLVSNPRTNTDFVHTATSGSISGHITRTSLTSSNLKLLVTPNWGTSGPYNKHSIGVWYNGTVWTIFNQDFSPMPANAKFNIKVVSNNAFIQHGVSNPGNHISYINNPLTDGKPNDLIFVTQNWGTSGPYNAHEVGVWYSAGKWTIFNQDRVKMPSRVIFNVYTTKPTTSGGSSTNCGTEDCVNFNPSNLKILKKGTNLYTVADGSHYLQSHPTYAEAHQAICIIQFYGINQKCYVGRPSSNGNNLMTYYLKNGQAPSGTYTIADADPEDALYFNPATVKAEPTGGGAWRVVGSGHIILHFGTNSSGNPETLAKKAACLIKKHGFKYNCYVGRNNSTPNRKPLLYFRK